MASSRKITFVLDMKDYLSKKYASAMKTLTDSGVRALKAANKTDYARYKAAAQANQRLLDLQTKHAAALAKLEIGGPAMLAKIQKRYASREQLARTSNKTMEQIEVQGNRAILRNEAKTEQKLAVLKATYNAKKRDQQILDKAMAEKVDKQASALALATAKAQYEQDKAMTLARFEQRRAAITMATQSELAIWQAYHQRKAQLEAEAIAREAQAAASQKVIDRVKAKQAVLLRMQESFNASSRALAAQAARTQLDIGIVYAADSIVIASARNKGTLKIQQELDANLTAMEQSHNSMMLKLKTFHTNQLLDIEKRQAAGVLSIEQAKDLKQIEMQRWANQQTLANNTYQLAIEQRKARAAVEFNIARAHEMKMTLLKEQEERRRFDIQKRWDARTARMTQAARDREYAREKAHIARMSKLLKRYQDRMAKIKAEKAARLATARANTVNSLAIGPSSAITGAAGALGGKIGQAGALASAVSPTAGYAAFVGGALLKAGPMIAAVGVSIMAVVAAFGLLSKAFKHAITTGIQFGQAMQDIAAIVRPTTQGLKQLTAQARVLGATSVFTATQAAEAFTELGKVGFSTNEILNSGSAILNLAGATGSTMEKAALSASKTIRQFGLDAKDTTHVVDVMTYAFSRSALDMYKFDEAMKYIGPVAKTAGVTFEQTTSYLAAMSDQGVDSTRAGTAMRTMFIELSNEASKVNRVLRKSGFETKNKTVDEKIKQLAKYRIEMAGIQTLFTKYASTGVTALLNSMQKANDIFGEFTSKAGGFAAETARMRLDNLEGDLRITKSLWEEFGLAMFDALGPSAREFVDRLNDSLVRLSNWVKENTPVLTSFFGTLERYLAGTAQQIEWVASKFGKLFSLMQKYQTKIGLRENTGFNQITLSDRGSHARWEKDMRMLRERSLILRDTRDQAKKLAQDAKAAGKNNPQLWINYSKAAMEYSKIQNTLQKGSANFTDEQIKYWEKARGFNDLFNKKMQLTAKLGGLNKRWTTALDDNITDADTAFVKHMDHTSQEMTLLEQYNKTIKDMDWVISWRQVFGDPPKDPAVDKKIDDRPLLPVPKSMRGGNGRKKVFEDRYYWLNLWKETSVKLEQERWDAINRMETLESQKQINSLNRAYDAYMEQYAGQVEKIQRKIASDKRKMRAGDLFVTPKSILQSQYDLINLKKDQVQVEWLLQQQIKDAIKLQEQYLANQLKAYELEGKMAKMRTATIRLSTDPGAELRGIDADLALKRAERKKVAKEMSDEYTRQASDVLHMAAPRQAEVDAIQAEIDSLNKQRSQALGEARRRTAELNALRVAGQSNSPGFQQTFDMRNDELGTARAAQVQIDKLTASMKPAIADNVKFYEGKINQLSSAHVKMLGELKTQDELDAIEAANARYEVYRDHFEKIKGLYETASEIAGVLNDMQVAEINRRYDLEEARIGRLTTARLISERTANVMQRRAEKQKEKDLREAMAIQKRWQVASVIMNTASAIMGTWSGYASMGPIGTAIAVGQTAMLAGLGVAQIAQIDAQRLATGGFPQGPNRLVQMNERGQEAVLNASATRRLGRKTIDNLNSGRSVDIAPRQTQTVNQTFVYSPSHNFETASPKVDILQALEQDREGFAKFVGDSRKRGYKV